MKRKISALVTGGLAALLVFVGAAGAQSQPGSGLSISPTVFNFSIEPGASTTMDLNLKDIEPDAVIAKAFVNDFVSDNATGNPRIITDPNQKSPQSIKDFVHGLSDVPLAKGEQKKVTLTISVPKNQPPGAYYGIIRYRAIPQVAANSNQGVSLTASVGAIVLVTVPGNIKDQVQLTGIHIYNKQNEHSFFLTKPNRAGIEMKNLGNGFAAPYGTVELTGMSSHQIYTYQLNNNNPRSNILPASSRIFDNQLKNIKSPGRYTLTANIVYGADNSILVGKKTFWYIPAWMLTAIIVVLAVLILLAGNAYRRHGRSLKRTHRKR